MAKSGGRGAIWQLVDQGLVAVEHDGTEFRFTAWVMKPFSLEMAQRVYALLIAKGPRTVDEIAVELCLPAETVEQVAEFLNRCPFLPMG